MYIILAVGNQEFELTFVALLQGFCIILIGFILDAAISQLNPTAADRKEIS